VKQLLRLWTAGDLARDDRETWMREPDPGRLFERLLGIAGPGRDLEHNPFLEEALLSASR
jgi:hypothetical protein